MAQHQELCPGTEVYTVHTHQSWIGASCRTTYFPKKSTVEDVTLFGVLTTAHADIVPIKAIYLDWKDCWIACPEDSDD